MKKASRIISFIMAFILTSFASMSLIVSPVSAATVDFVDNSEAQKISATEEGISVELTWSSGYIGTSSSNRYKLVEYATIFHSNVICVEKAGTEISWTDTTKNHFLSSGGYSLSSWVKDANGYWQGNENGANFKGNEGAENSNNIEHLNADGTVTYKYITGVDNECLILSVSNKNDKGAALPAVSFKLTGERGTLDTMNILKHDTRDALTVSATKEGIELDVEWNWGYFSSGTEDDKSGSEKYTLVQTYAGIFSTQVICVEKAGTEITWVDMTTSHYLTAGGLALSSWTKNADGVWVPNVDGASYIAAGGSEANEIQTPQENGYVVYKYVTTKDNECIRLSISQRSDDPLGKSIPQVSFKLIAEETEPVVPENPETGDTYTAAVAITAFVSLFGAALIVSKKHRA